MTVAPGPGCDIRRVVLAPSAYHPSLGGVEELTSKLAQALRDRGITPSVSTMRWPKDLPRTETVEGIDVHRHLFRAHEGGPRRVAIATATTPIVLTALAAELHRAAPDVLHIQCVSQAAWYQPRVAGLLRIPLVVTLQGELGMDATHVFDRSARLRTSLRSILLTADAVTACSAHTLREAEEWLGQPLGDRARVVYNGVDVDEIRRAGPHPHPHPYVFALGRHVPQKGFDVPIDAFARLPALPDGPVDLVIAGEGSESDSLRDQADRLGVGPRTHLVGRTSRDETAAWLRGAAAFALPSRHEPFGIVNLEAMAAGTPVIASAVGGVPEFVDNDVSGLLVEPGNPGQLAQALASVLTEPALRERLAAAGSRQAERFRWDRLVDEYLDVYRDAMARRHRTAT